ncbi:hypothetical protein Ancab_039899 [Ancistrocladus abbreviatus]
MASSIPLSASTTATATVSSSFSPPSTSSSCSSTSSDFRRCSFSCSGSFMPYLSRRPSVPNTAAARAEFRRRLSAPRVVCMAPEEEKITRRSPLDFPIEWERPKPGRRPDIFPQFSPMKAPLPPPMPADPPEEDEEEEEKKEEEEEDPEKEDDKPEKQQ